MHLTNTKIYFTIFRINIVQTVAKCFFSTICLRICSLLNWESFWETTIIHNPLIHSENIMLKNWWRPFSYFLLVIKQILVPSLSTRNLPRPLLIFSSSILFQTENSVFMQFLHISWKMQIFSPDLSPWVKRWIYMIVMRQFSILNISLLTLLEENNLILLTKNLCWKTVVLRCSNT